MIDLTPVLQALSALAWVVFTALIIPLIKSRMSAQRLERLLAWAKIAVKAAEQLHTQPGSGQAKKIYALRLIDTHLGRIDSEDASAAVECCVNDLKCGQSVMKEDEDEWHF
ncbi:MAG: phage holin family protein [Oscillospiraceae bacterium]|nr:phage holin family protein [Oscillospiraceae bacterium]